MRQEQNVLAATRCIIPDKGSDAKAWARKLGPPKFRRFLANISPFSLPKDFLDVTDTLEEASKMVLSKKREALEKGEDAINELAGKGKDIISVLCEIFYIW